MKFEDVKTIAVIGAGDMGHGIAETALMAGYKVYLRDVTQAYLDKGLKRIYDSLEKLVSKGRVPSEILDNARAGMLVPVVDLAESVKEADLVIEAIPEIMDLKKETFQVMDQAAPAHAIFASNTSTMSITEIATATSREDKFLGLHYFNPAVLMKLVEVIRGEKTSEQTMQIGVDFAVKCGKVAVRVEKDVPGFIVNRTQAPSSVLLSCYLDQEVFEPEEVDASMRKMGAPMGPYETIDFAGLDVAYHGNKYYAEAIHPDFALGRVFTEKYEAGHLGKKSGRGIFDWSNGRPEIDLEKASPKFDPMDFVAVNLNEATKIIAQGACALEDIDLAVTNGTGAMFGPVGLMQNTSPEDLTKRLENLAQKFDKEIFKPTEEIKNGGYILPPPKNIHMAKTGHIATITIDHPPANAWNLETVKQFKEAFDEIEADKSVRVVVITGAGKCFSAGFDVSDAANGPEIGAIGRSLWRAIDRSTKPFIAAINGYAMGGGLELAMCCHFRIMAEHPKNKIGLTELNLGIIPGWGGTQNLARIVGKSRALDMMLFSKRVEAKEALEIGLVNQVSTPEDLMKDAMSLAERLAARAPLAVAGVLDALSAGEYEGLDKGWEVEAKHTGIVSQSKDAMEGFSAFMEKRAPEFKGE